MEKVDSEKHWLGVRTNLTKYDVRLGTATAQDYIHDAKHIAFVASRYKFAGKMVNGLDKVLEIGCGDGFGAPFLAQGCTQLFCADIDREQLADNSERLRVIPNMEFSYHDFRTAPFHEKVDAICLVDVIEHIFPEEEADFLANAVGSLNPNGIAIIGTPNISADAYASPNSKIGHVNLKDHKSLKSVLSKHFHNIFMFSMNDEVLHTGFFPMSHYLWAVCANRKINTDLKACE